MKDRAIAILAGGIGSRLHPYTLSKPKSLIEVAGKPFILHQIDLIKKQGLKHVVLCVGFLGEKIQGLLGDGSQMDISISYSFDGTFQLGTAGALKKALPSLGDEFFVLYGDSYLEIDLSSISNMFEKRNKLGLITIYYNQNLYGKSNILFKNGRILKYQKHHKKEDAPDLEYIDYGISLFKCRTFDMVPQGQYCDLSYVFQNLIREEQLIAFEVEKRFYEIGSLSGLEETGQYISGVKGTTL